MSETADVNEQAPPSMSEEQFVNKAREAGWNEKSEFNYAAFVGNARTETPWAGAAAKYEWKDEYGDIGPEVPELEQILFEEKINRKGEHYVNIELPVKVTSKRDIHPVTSFDNAGLHPVVLKNVELALFDTPTPIQRYAIPAILQGRDVVGVAQTGSGKTGAYLIPILSKLMGKAKKLAGPRPNISAPDYDPDSQAHRVRAEPLVVIVVPARELALQIFDEARRLCYRSMLRPCVAYGEFPYQQQLKDLGAGCDMLIATPGRLCDLMRKPHIFTMSRVKYTVIDEADELLESDWQEELKMIMEGGDTNQDADHVFIMFSATFSSAARDLARAYMDENYVRIRVGRAGQSHKNIRQSVIYVDKEVKDEALYDLIFASEVGRTLIFSNFKAEVDRLDAFLHNRGLPCTMIHSGRNQIEREDAMRAFRTGKCPILVSTGVSARGWDVKDVMHVINYDLPSTMYGGITEYIHRIGRTARIGHQGLATSFYNEKNEDIAQDLVNVLVECSCDVPDFLQHLAPEDGKIIFDDVTDDEDEAADLSADGGAASAGAEGGSGSANQGSGFQADNGFSSNAPAANNGW